MGEEDDVVPRLRKRPVRPIGEPRGRERPAELEREVVEVEGARLGGRQLCSLEKVGVGASRVDTGCATLLDPGGGELLRAAVAEDIPVLGICFGGQALAAALGGRISVAEPPEVGWFETRTSEPDLVYPGPWLHFNSERFALPDGATLVASLGESASAFRLGPHLGLQFHPEATPALAGRWADHYTEWLGAHGLTPAAIRDQARAQADAVAPRAFALFDAWWAGATGPA